jgi:hypothetical protein
MLGNIILHPVIASFIMNLTRRPSCIFVQTKSATGVEICYAAREEYDIFNWSYPLL